MSLGPNAKLANQICRDHYLASDINGYTYAGTQIVAYQISSNPEFLRYGADGNQYCHPAVLVSNPKRFKPYFRRLPIMCGAAQEMRDIREHHSFSPNLKLTPCVAIFVTPMA